MTKYFCDRCGKECEDLEQISIPDKKSSNGSIVTKSIEVCPDCEKEFINLIDKIIDIRLTLFRDFMKGGE